MTVRVSKPKFNLREKLSELDKPTGVKGNDLMRSDTSQEARDLISAGRKNKIINGAMLIDQRHNGSSHTSSNNYHTDRFRTQTAGMDQLNQSYQRVSDGPDGFPRSLKITTNTAESDVASSGEYISLYQKIEGQNLQDLAYGTIGAKPVTVSFYVKSSITGTFGYTVYRNDTTDRAINKTYTINNANTWERKNITLEGDTVQTIENSRNDNWWNVWHLGASTGYMSAPASAWANYTGANWAGFHNQNGVITTQGATWQITGIQMEIGENATEFEHRSYGEELALCQRYYQMIDGTSDLTPFAFGRANGTQIIEAAVPLTVPLRATPTLTCSHNTAWGHANANTSTSTPTIGRWTKYATVLHVTFGGHSGMTNGRVANVHCGSSSNFIMDAEL